MAQLYDLKSCIAEVTATIDEPKTYIGGDAIGAVPKGKTRFITGIKIVNTDVVSVEVHIGEGDHGEMAGTTPDTPTLDRIKDQQIVAKGDTIMYPDTPNKEHPLMTIAEEKFLTLETDTGTADVFITYFDD